MKTFGMTLARAAVCGLLIAMPAATFAQEAQDPAVKARIDVMKTIRMSTGTLGDMASGKAAFDAAAAGQAKTALATAAAQIPVVFEAQADDPVSESKPNIWTDWATFAADAKKLEDAATAIDVSSVETLKAGMGAAGGTCRACHTVFRE